MPNLIARNWEQSRIIKYIADDIAASTELSPAKVRQLLVSFAKTPAVIKNRNRNGQINFGKTIGSQMANIMKNYRKIPNTGPGRFAAVRRGALIGFGSSYFPGVAKAINVVRRA